MRRRAARTRPWPSIAAPWNACSNNAAPAPVGALEEKVLRAAALAVLAAVLGCGGVAPNSRQHAPYRAHACNSCHDTEGSASFTPAAAVFKLPAPPEGSESEPSLDDKMKSRLRYRVDRLCFQCHKRLDIDASKETNRWIHGPFRAGACLGCHDPHESPYPKLLTAGSWQELCGRCHPGFHGQNDDSRRSRACKECHYPHAGPGMKGR